MPRRWPKAQLGGLAMVALVEAGLARSGLGVDPVGLEWRYGDKAARRRASTAQVIGLGDSLIRYGLDPKVLRERLGLEARNLGLSAAPPSATDLVLAHALEAGARPAAILVDISPFLLDGSATPSDHLRPEVATLADALGLAVADRDASEFALLTLGRLVPSVAGRQRLRERLAGRRPCAEPTPPWFAGGWSTLVRMLYPADWRCLPTRRAAVERLLGRADGLGIAVYWLMPPFDDAVAERRRALGVEDRYTGFARQMQALFPGLMVIDGRRLAYDASLRADPIHLNPTGARAFSAEVADVLARPPASRWADLGTGGLLAPAASGNHDKRQIPGRVAALAGGP